MTATLRPMNLGEILDRTFQIYRARFLVFVGIAALAALATMGVEVMSYLLWGSYPPYTLDLGFGITVAELGFMLGFYHFSLFFELLIWPSYAYAVSDFDHGQLVAPTLRSTLQMSAVRWQRSLALSATLLACVLVLPELVSTGLFLGFTYILSEVLKFDGGTMDLVLPPLLIFFCILGWASIGWISSALSSAIPSRALEGLSVQTALRRGRKLSKGSRLRIFVAWLMPAILGWVLSLTVSRILFLLGSSCRSYVFEQYVFQFRTFAMVIPWYGRCVSPPVVEVIRIGSGAVISTLLGPIYPIAVTLFYYDQRIRREGYDIERMMDAAGMTAPEPSLAGDGASTHVAEEVQP